MVFPNDSDEIGSTSFPPSGASSSPAPAQNSSSSRSRKPADEFTGPSTPCQLRLPNDLITSLRLLALQQGRSMSDLAFEALTSEATIAKAWVSTRKAG
jgi:hypothetical protein